MGGRVSASPVHAVVKGQASPVAHLLIPKKFGRSYEIDGV